MFDQKVNNWLRRHLDLHFEVSVRVYYTFSKLLTNCLCSVMQSMRSCLCSTLHCASLMFDLLSNLFCSFLYFYFQKYKKRVKWIWQQIEHKRGKVKRVVETTPRFAIWQVGTCDPNFYVGDDWYSNLPLKFIFESTFSSLKSCFHLHIQILDMFIEKLLHLYWFHFSFFFLYLIAKSIFYQKLLYSKRVHH